MSTVHCHRTEALADPEALRALLETAFAGGFREADWRHALGGRHFLVEDDGRPVAHAAVIERTLVLDATEVRAAYVEAVATHPAHRGRGHATRVMRQVGAFVAAGYALGGLSAGIPEFYERLGWRSWRGPTYVRRDRERIRTPEDDGTVMVLPTPTSPPLDLAGPIACTWRPGEVW